MRINYGKTEERALEEGSWPHLLFAQDQPRCSGGPVPAVCSGQIQYVPV